MEYSSLKQVSKCSWKVISVIWDLVVSPIVLPEAKGMLFTWLSKHFPLLDKEARVKLSGILTFCSDSLKDVPGYDRFYRASMGNDTITRFLSVIDSNESYNPWFSDNWENIVFPQKCCLDQRFCWYVCVIYILTTFWINCPIFCCCRIIHFIDSFTQSCLQMGLTWILFRTLLMKPLRWGNGWGGHCACALWDLIPVRSGSSTVGKLPG